jgi:hypothetical protein
VLNERATRDRAASDRAPLVHTCFAAGGPGQIAQDGR